MKFLMIIKCNSKKLCKDPRIFTLTFILPLIISLTLGLLLDRSSDSEKIYLINNDQGEWSQLFINEIKEENPIVLCSRDEGLQLLKGRKISVCYEIPSSFSKEIDRGNKPSVIADKIDSNNIGMVDFELLSNSVLNKLTLVSELKQSGVDSTAKDLSDNSAKITIQGKSKMNPVDGDILHFIISFIFFDSIILSSYLFELKKDNILLRSMTTANKTVHIIGGILAAAFLVIFVSLSLVFILQAFVRGSESLAHIGLYLINIAIAVFVSLSIGVVISKICHSETMVIFYTQMICWVSCFLGGAFAPLDIMPEQIRYVARFMPQYYIISSVEKQNAAMGLIAVLFGIALFTGGVYKRPDTYFS